MKTNLPKKKLPAAAVWLSNTFALFSVTDVATIDERSIVERPNQTQSCAFVVDSRTRRGSRNIFKLFGPTAVESPPLLPFLRSNSAALGLNFEAYTTHEATNTTMAKQNAVNSTYIPISSGLILCWWWAGERGANAEMPPRCWRAWTVGSWWVSSFNWIPATKFVYFQIETKAQGGGGTN